MEIFFDPNGNDIKVCWRSSQPGSALSKPYLVSAEALKHCSEAVRKNLAELNKYMRGNPGLDEDRDRGWQRYSEIISDLRHNGELLRAQLIDAGRPWEDADKLDRRLRQLPAHAPIIVHCSTQGVTIPVGFICDGDAPPPPRRPCRADFDDCWINRFQISIRLSGTVCETDKAVDRAAFRAIYALNRDEKNRALANLIDSDLEAEHLQFESLTTINQRDHYDWADIRQECDKIRDLHAIFFVFAHSNGEDLEFGKTDRLVWGKFGTILRQRSEDHIALVIFNCCTSAKGSEGGSLLSTVAQPGCCGLIGTEAEIDNTGALRCGIRLMWNLCVNGHSLGDAFNAMQNSEDLFPLNLFYTCYAARDFRLDSPITFPLQEVAA